MKFRKRKQEENVRDMAQPGERAARGEPLTMPLSQCRDENGEPLTMPLSQRRDEDGEPLTMPLSQRRDEDGEPLTMPLSQRRDEDGESLTMPLSQRRVGGAEEVVAASSLRRNGNAQPNGYGSSPLSNAILRAIEGDRAESGGQLQEACSRRLKQMTGWLVCVEGQAFGDSFALQNGENRIGSAKEMEVALPAERGIASRNHAVITYEPGKREFTAKAGGARELFYVNDTVVLLPVQLKQHDILSIGTSRLMFFPCCGEKFCWEDYRGENG